MKARAHGFFQNPCWQVQSRKDNCSFWVHYCSGHDRFQGYSPQPVALTFLPPTFRDAPWAVKMLWLSQQRLNKMTQRSPPFKDTSFLTNYYLWQKKILWLSLWTGLLYQQEASNLGCQCAHLAKQKFTWKPLGSPAMAFPQPTAPGLSSRTGNELRSQPPTFTDAAKEKCLLII